MPNARPDPTANAPPDGSGGYNVVSVYDASLERSRETHPLGFVGEPEDTAELVTFLLWKRAHWITGGLYALDGGRALTSLR